MCSHKELRCSLIQTIDGYHREDICKSCGSHLNCNHFDLSKQVFKFESDYFSSSEDDLTIDDIDAE